MEVCILLLYCNCQVKSCFRSVLNTLHGIISSISITYDWSAGRSHYIPDFKNCSCAGIGIIYVKTISILYTKLDLHNE